jgi:hypothetical protein
LTGKGDSIVDVDNTIGAAIVHIQGNAVGNYFSVKNYGDDGESIDLLVNTTDPYDGFLLLDFREGEHTIRFEVKAVGEWFIEILPLSVARVLEAPGIIEGKGDEVIKVSNSILGLIKVKGNASSLYFSVKNYGEDTQLIDLLVNTTDPYEGIRPLDFREGENTTWLEIKSEDEWTIEIMPISYARVLNVPGKIDGKGDDVIVLSGSVPDLAKIVGNAESLYFSVKNYSSDGYILDLLVNTTDPYEGMVILSKDTAFLEIVSEGDWSIEITTKK